MSDEQETRYLTRTFRLGHRDLAQKLRKRAAQVWNDTRDEFYRDKSEEISEKEMKKRICNGNSDQYQMSARALESFTEADYIYYTR